jgi:hypothetical protein
MSDHAEAFRRIWRAFTEAERVADGRHDTPGWRGRGGPFAFCCVRIPALELQPDLDGVRLALGELPWVRLHPDHFLHVMLQEFGFVVESPRRRDEITPARLEELTAAAIAVGRDNRGFDLSLNSINAFRDAVFLQPGRGAGRCTRLHQRLREVAAVVTAPRYPYLPLATIAHFTGDVPIGDLPERLQSWRGERFGGFPVRQIEVVTLRTDEPYPPLESHAVIPLVG